MIRQPVRKEFGGLFSVIVVPTLKDNFSYLIHDNTTGTVAAVDVNADYKPLLDYVKQNQLNTITTILSTHKHWDHAGGNEELKKHVLAHHADSVRQLHVIGGKRDAIPGVTQAVSEGDVVMLGQLKAEVLDVPCHTKGHVAYKVSHPGSPSNGAALFTGDTLFLGGIGAFFEGNAADMCAAMHKLYDVNRENQYALDHNTFIFPGHEYTASFINFSVKEAPKSEAETAEFLLRQRQKYADLVAKGLPSVPSSLAEEKRQNLFLRVCEDAFRRQMKTTDEVALMDYLYNACD